jgi:putative FmdB family regulatory protein
MPLYEYRCKSCQHVFTELAKFEDKIKCPECKKSTEKLIATTNHPVFVHQTRFRKKRRRA